MAKKYINPHLSNKAFAQKNHPVEYYVKGLTLGDMQVLSQAITLVESERLEDKEKAYQILKHFEAQNKDSLRIGISGSPGVGKSSLIESLCSQRKNLKIAVLAVDPSSSVTGGSILGDKTRMNLLSTQKNAFVRPSPAGKTLGGVTNATRESVLLCEAAGYDIIFIETVGVGQSETVVSTMVDLFILLILPGSGDEIQGIKRGIMELADAILITKYEEERKSIADQSRRSIINALHLFPIKYPGWKIPVINTSAMEDYNMDEVWKMIYEFRAFAQKDHWLEQHRLKQNRKWYDEQLELKIQNWLLSKDHHKELKQKHLKQISEGQVDIHRMLGEYHF